MVNDALANGTGFIPTSGQVMAAICFPQFIVPPPGPLQDSIIEVPVPAPPPPLTLNVNVSGDAQLVSTNSYRMDSGGAAAFNASVQGGTQPYYYTWYVDGAVNSTDQSLTFTTQQIGVYPIYVRVTDSGNPAQQITSPTYLVTVQVVPPAFNVTVTVSGDAQLVGTNSYHMNSGASATFVANVQGGTQPYYYTWYVDGAVNSTDQSLTFTAAQIGTYLIYVNATDSGNPAQQRFSATYSVTVPEYSLLAIALLSVALIPVIVLARKKRAKV
jgi:hypothetical protein